MIAKNELSNNDEPDLVFKIRSNMLEQLRSYGIKDPQILDVMEQIPRHHYIPKPCNDLNEAYGDYPIRIGFHQTISQPYVVAYMSELLKIKDGEKVLEIGTGSGYQTAILASLGALVYSVEIISELAEFAATTLQKEGFENIQLKEGDGYKGWEEHSPYQAIIVTCAPESIPQSLIDQLDHKGRLLLPLGSKEQRLVLLQKRGNEITTQEELPVRFVPMVHRPNQNKQF